MKLFTTFDILEDMSALSRYSQTHLMKPESVLEHTGFVAAFCYFVCLYMAKEKIFVDTGLVLRRALAHDIDEVIAGGLCFVESIFEPVGSVDKGIVLGCCAKFEPYSFKAAK